MLGNKNFDNSPKASISNSEPIGYAAVERKSTVLETVLFEISNHTSELSNINEKLYIILSKIKPSYITDNSVEPALQFEGGLLGNISEQLYIQNNIRKSIVDKVYILENLI